MRLKTDMPKTFSRTIKLPDKRGTVRIDVEIATPGFSEPPEWVVTVWFRKFRARDFAVIRCHRSDPDFVQGDRELQEQVEVREILKLVDEETIVDVIGDAWRALGIFRIPDPAPENEKVSKGA